MKKLILTITAAVSLSAAYAQKGSVLYWGNFGGSNVAESNASRDNSGWAILINQGVGYQFSKHITAGVQGGYYHGSLKTTIPAPFPSTSVIATSEYGVGAFGRYTAYLGTRLFVYLQADAGYNRKWIDGTPVHQGIWGADLFPAVGLEVYKGWAINMNVGTIAVRHSETGGTRYTTLAYNLGQSFTFGISKNFRCGNKNKPVTETKG